MNTFQIIKNKNRPKIATNISVYQYPETQITIILNDDVITPEAQMFYLIKPENDPIDSDYFNDLHLSLYPSDKNCVFNIINVSENTKVYIKNKLENIDSIEPSESLSLLYSKNLDKYFII